MKNSFQFDAFEKKVLDDLVKHHAKLYIVGGAIRDLILFNKTNPHDIDIEIYHLPIDDLIKILSQYGHVRTVGKSFGIVKLDTLPRFDFALPRLEVKTGHTHRDFQVSLNPDMDLKEACRRRDFTMNSLMYDYQTHHIYDFFGGIEDLNHHVIKMIDEKSFQEDPLRILRAAQFASRLEMTVDIQTQQLCKKMIQAGALQHLSHERIVSEYNKLLMSNKPSIGLKFLLKINGLFKPLMVLKDCHQRLDYHPEDDVMSHTLLVVDLAALCKHHTSYPLGFMWGALLHDIGKPLVTTSDGRAPGHNESGVQVFNEHFAGILQNQRLNQYVRTMIYYHMHLMNMARNHSRDFRFYQLLKGIDGIMPLEDLVLISKCDKLGRYDNRPETIKLLDDFIEDKTSRLGKEALKPVITGKDLLPLGIQGSQFKVLLDWAYELQMKGHDKFDIMHLIKEKLNGR